LEVLGFLTAFSYRPVFKISQCLREYLMFLLFQLWLGFAGIFRISSWVSMMRVYV